MILNTNIYYYYILTQIKIRIILNKQDLKKQKINLTH
jgi:hypothetical protein